MTRDTRQMTAVDLHHAEATIRPTPPARRAQESGRRAKTELRPRVLLVDVDPLSRARFGRALVTSGVDVCIATSTEETLRALDEGVVDAIALLTTSSDGALDVVELLESIARASSDVAIIARSHTPDAYELFLRSFGFGRTAVFARDASDGARAIKEFAEHCAGDI